VTVTAMVAAAVNMHDSVALPEPVTVEGEMLHAVLFVVKPTTPAKPFEALTWIVEAPAVPAFVVRLVGLAVRLKS
jgi:hypothetical protein